MINIYPRNNSNSESDISSEEKRKVIISKGMGNNFPNCIKCFKSTKIELRGGAGLLEILRGKRKFSLCGLLFSSIRNYVEV